MQVWSVVVADVEAYVGTNFDTEKAQMITGAIEAEADAQAKICRKHAAHVDYPDDLREALMRRVVRNVAVRGIPLGFQPAPDGGTASRVTNDSEIRRLEAPHRKLVLG